MNAPRPDDVSVYIPARDAARTLERAIASVRAQSVAPAELLLVVDLRSRDDTRAVARAAGARIVEQTVGPLGHARNLAIRACRTPWLASLDADVTLDPDWLERLLEAGARPAAGGGSVAAVGGRTEELLHTDADRWRAVNLPHNWGPAAFDDPFMLVSEMLASVAALRGVGGYRPDLQAYEDSDLCQRLRAAGFSLRYEPAALARHDRRDTVASVLDLRWKYSAYRQRARLDDLPGLIAKLRVNRSYCLQSLSQTLHSPHADVCAISLFLWFHHARRDLICVLDKWPLIDAATRSACLERLDRALVGGLSAGGVEGQRPDARGWPAFVESMNRVIPPAPTAAVPAPCVVEAGRSAEPPAEPRAPRHSLADTPGFAAYLDAVRRATLELREAIPARLVELLVDSAARLAGQRETAPPAFDPADYPVSEADERRLAEVPRQPTWPPEFGRAVEGALGADALEAPLAQIGPVLPAERIGLASAPTVRAAAGAPRDGLVLLPHLESFSDPIGQLRAALRGARAAVVGYQTPRLFLPAVPILQPRDLASVCAAEGFNIRCFETEAGLTRLCVERAGPARPRPADPSRQTALVR